MKCKNCNLDTVGNSKYCKIHKKAAFDAWKDIIQKSNEERAEKNERFAQIFEEARIAGEQAMAECHPTPMIVQEHASMIDDTSPVVDEYFVSGGVCGFAWINIRPGNCPAANYAKKHLGAGKDYYGGTSIWVHEGGQSMERKESYAHAYADVLQKNGIDAHTMSRID
jgi:hypothetical protein